MKTDMNILSTRQIRIKIQILPLRYTPTLYTTHHKKYWIQDRKNMRKYRIEKITANRLVYTNGANLKERQKRKAGKYQYAFENDA